MSGPCSTKPLAAKLGVPLSELQVTFSLLIVLQTFFSPFQGALIERFGPRRLIAAGTVMAGLSWVLAASAQSVGMLYLTYGVVGGLGTGIVYIGVVGQMVRWFPDRRGFAVGMVAAGYGMGAIVTTFPIASALAGKGLETTLWQFGLIFAVIGFLASQGLRAPAPGEQLPVRASYTPLQRGGRADPSDAQDAAVLAAVPDDDDDVHVGADGHLADGRLRQGLRGVQRGGVRHGRAAAGADHRPRSPTG